MMQILPHYVLSGMGEHTPVSELATTLAHERAVKRFLDSDAEYAVIMEDDIALVNLLHPRCYQLHVYLLHFQLVKVSKAYKEMEGSKRGFVLSAAFNLLSKPYLK